MDEIKKIFESVMVNKVYDMGDWCYKYYSEHGEKWRFDCYEDALREELIALGIIS